MPSIRSVPFFVRDRFDPALLSRYFAESAS